MSHLVCRYIALLLFSRVLDKTLFSSFIFVSFYFSTKILWSTLELPERDNSHTYLQYGSVPDLNPAEGGIQLMTVRCLIAQSLSLSSFHCLDMS